MHDSIRNATIYERDESHGNDDMSDTRTFSYQSDEWAPGRDEDDDDELSEPDIADSVEKSKKAIEGRESDVFMIAIDIQMKMQDLSSPNFPNRPT